MSVRPNIVLVHGAGADGSSWSAVVDRLQADGYHITAPQFPGSSLAADVARLREVLARQDGPTTPTAVRSSLPWARMGPMSSAWSTSRHSASIRANRSARSCSKDRRPAMEHLDIDEQGFACLPEDDFVNHFAADVDPARARVMHAVQQSLHSSALNEVMSAPSWKSHPS